MNHSNKVLVAGHVSLVDVYFLDYIGKWHSQSFMEYVIRKLGGYPMQRLEMS